MGSSRKLHARCLDAAFSAWLSSHAAGTRLRNRDPRNHRTRFARQPSGRPQSARTLRGSVNASTQRFLLLVLTRILGVLITDAARRNLVRAECRQLFHACFGRKIFTTALALQRSTGVRVRTTISTTGTLDANGVLNGDLVLTGRGDANLSNRKFRTRKKSNTTARPKKRSQHWPMPSRQAV